MSYVVFALLSKGKTVKFRLVWDYYSTLARAILIGKGCLELRLSGAIAVRSCGNRRLLEFPVLQRFSLRFCGKR